MFLFMFFMLMPWIPIRVPSLLVSIGGPVAKSGSIVFFFDARLQRQHPSNLQKPAQYASRELNRRGRPCSRLRQFHIVRTASARERLAARMGGMQRLQKGLRPMAKSILLHCGT